MRGTWDEALFSYTQAAYNVHFQKGLLLFRVICVMFDVTAHLKYGRRMTSHKRHLGYQYRYSYRLFHGVPTWISLTDCTQTVGTRRIPFNAGVNSTVVMLMFTSLKIVIEECAIYMIGYARRALRIVQMDSEFVQFCRKV